MNVLLGTISYNYHIQNVARALYENDMLARYLTGGADNIRNPGLRLVREGVLPLIPPLARALKRRRITSVPGHLVYPDWSWEGPRVIAAKAGLGERVVDWLWERSELSLDSKCAALLRNDSADAFFGVEHGCLESVKTAGELGKKSVVAFMSPHRNFRVRFVDVEYDKYPELATPAAAKLRELSVRRDERRDKEARLADFICTNSELTARTIVDAGFDREKIINVPLGGPVPSAGAGPPSVPGKPVRFLYAGSVIIRKGVQYLFEAWDMMGATSGAELHVYGGGPLLSRLEGKGHGNTHFHGVVSADELERAYRSSSALVFPTLCDGFGMVVLEAMARGLPVITTENAGSASFVRDGENGLIVPPADSEGLARALSWCINNPDRLSRMGAEALETARGWTWVHYRNVLGQMLKDRLGR